MINGDNKCAPDILCPRINKDAFEFGKQLKWDNAIENAVQEIKLLQTRWKGFHMKVKEIDRSVLNKFENLGNRNNTRLLIKECY